MNTWEVHPSPYGKPYYFNPLTKESRWALPTGPLDVVVLPKEKSDTAEATPGISSSDKAADKDESTSSDSSTSEEEGGEKGSDATTAEEKARAKLRRFAEMLEERGIRPFDRYEKCVPKLLGDSRFTDVPLSERKALFQQEVKRLGTGRRKTDAEVKRKGQQALSELLTSVIAQGVFDDVQSAEEALEKLATSDFSKDERWRLAAHGDRQRLVTRVFGELIAQRRARAEHAAKDFRALLGETVLSPAKVGAEMPTFDDAQNMLGQELRWKAVDTVAQRQQIFATVASEASKQWLAKKRRQAEDEDELLEHRKKSKRSEAEHDFRQLLVQHINFPLELTWAEVQILLRDSTLVVDLDEAGQEWVFNQLCKEDLERRCACISEALHQSSADEIGPELPFMEAYRLVVAKVGEVRVRGVPEAELKRLWEDWRRLRLEEAMDAFGSWLRKCEHISEAARDPMAREGVGEMFKALQDKLRADKRYVRLDSLPNRRNKIILDRLREAAETVQKPDLRAEECDD
eukprot:TRINITY_DN21372_c0_g1_i1.p1 TRINITY_DN21372_c0_g1~~TRINITY_DN21372_c0_g1_i1.p1  ORF type:complete len:517 (-),score=131.59 TRINITY_DN21372_c0_g1_i1:12-1562(-)